jgi:hypothetical protein
VKPQEEGPSLLQVITDCRYGVALIMLIAAMICLLLSAMGTSVLVNALLTVACGPGAAALSVTARYRRWWS